MAHALLARAEAAAFRGLMALPRPVMRRLAGRPVVLDGQRLDVETQWMLRIRQLVREPDAAELDFPTARALIDRQTRMTGGRQPIGEVRDLDVPGGAGPVAARLYVPRSAAPTSPLLVFLHGGGFMYGGLASHDASCRLLAERAGARVLAVDYRLAPEHVFPAAVDDAWAAYQWAAEHADRLGADPDRIGVAGDSAGGCLAAIVARRAAESGVPCALQLLVYPIANAVDPSASRTAFAEGFYLTERFIDLAEKTYVAGADLRDPEVSIAYTEKLPDGLAPAIVVTAGFDPLRDEGEEWARTLADAGVDVTLRRYGGLVHGFCNMAPLCPVVEAAMREISAKIAALIHTSA